MIKFKDLEMRKLAWIYQGGPNLIPDILKSGEHFPAAENQRAGVLRTQPAVAGFEDGGRAPRTMNQGCSSP